MSESFSASARAAIANRIEVKAMQTLMGMVTGIVCDGALHNLEIQLLSTWLAENAETAATWPGSVIAQRVRAVLADGVVTEDERSDLLDTLTELSNTDFAATGSAQSEPLGLPIDDSCSPEFSKAGVVHTGKFIFGTRAACEALSQALGALPQVVVTKATGIVIIGTRVSPSWAAESYGRKILAGVKLKQAGHPLHIISERYWLDHAKARGHAS